MASQLDLDQGGTVRQWDKIYLGPSVGWVNVPHKNILNITAANAVATIDLSTNYVQVNAATLVTLTLPSTLQPTIPANSIPGLFARAAVSILDVGGHADAFAITILPAAGDLIMGLASIQITSKYGGFILYPSPGQREWTNQS